VLMCDAERSWNGSILCEAEHYTWGEDGGEAVLSSAGMAIDDIRDWS
jgi:hypothetical protein